MDVRVSSFASGLPQKFTVIVAEDAVAFLTNPYFIVVPLSSNHLRSFPESEFAIIVAAPALAASN
jgi:hypothetical protein